MTKTLVLSKLHKVLVLSSCTTIRGHLKCCQHPRKTFISSLIQDWQDQFQSISPFKKLKNQLLGLRSCHPLHKTLHRHRTQGNLTLRNSHLLVKRILRLLGLRNKHPHKKNSHLHRNKLLTSALR